MAPGELDRSGRGRPVPIAGSEFTIEADTIITAIGQSPDLSFMPGDLDLAVSGWGSIVVDEGTLATNVPGIFAAGDCVTGPRTIIEGIAAGHRAARSIDEYLRGKGRPVRPLEALVAETHDRYEDYDRIQRQAVPTLPVETRIQGLGEVERGFDRKRALKEASRCLKCHLNIFIDGQKCVLCGGCVDVCPFNCIELVPIDRIELVEHPLEGESGSHEVGTAMIHHGEKCIRCGLCVDRCPARAISMMGVELEPI
jgi:formate dehydrogenase major subunit